MRRTENISLIEHKAFDVSDLAVGIEYWSKFGDKDWRKMLIKTKGDLLNVIKNYDTHEKVVEMASERIFTKYGMIPSKAVVLPDWYNLTEDCVVYQGGIEQYELEIPIFVYHEDKKLLSMFLMNRTHTIRQLYQVFIGAKCETVNDVARLLKDFIHEGENCTG